MPELPATVIFWTELALGMAAALFIGWCENEFASMARLNGTVMLV